MIAFHDVPTLQAYDENAIRFSLENPTRRNLNALQLFARALHPGARVLDLGCGSGWASQRLLRLGFKPALFDGSPVMAAAASAKLEQPAEVKPFEHLSAEDEYDGVFACASLPHAPKPALPIILNRIAASLRADGLFYACFLSGSSDNRDEFGRYYARWQADELLALIPQTPGLKLQSLRTEAETMPDGSLEIFFGLSARKLAYSIM